MKKYKDINSYSFYDDKIDFLVDLVEDLSKFKRVVEENKDSDFLSQKSMDCMYCIYYELKDVLKELEDNLEESQILLSKVGKYDEWGYYN